MRSAARPANTTTSISLSSLLMDISKMVVILNPSDIAFPTPRLCVPPIPTKTHLPKKEHAPSPQRETHALKVLVLAFATGPQKENSRCSTDERITENNPSQDAAQEEAAPQPAPSADSAAGHPASAFETSEHGRDLMPSRLFSPRLQSETAGCTLCSEPPPETTTGIMLGRATSKPNVLFLRIFRPPDLRL